MTTILPVILAGGSGTRLWPVSREALPKHLAQLIGPDTLLQRTARRLLRHAAASHLITVAAQAQDLLIRRQYAAIDPALNQHRLIEPIGRNTAAAIALAALYAADHMTPQAVLWVCPSDHLISDADALAAAVEQAVPVALAGDLVTFGISPTRPETGYGYIRTGAPLPGRTTARRVERFVEKPERAAAEAMLAAGGHYWNSGMFMFRADRILAELAQHAGEILSATEAALAAAERVEGATLPPLELYRRIPSSPIDKAVMERATRLAVVPCDPGWTDLGSWHAIWEQLPKDGAGNAVVGDVLLEDVSGCLIQAGHRLVACAGVRDLAVIETEDALLVADRSIGEPIKALVAQLKAVARSEAVHPALRQQAWGSSRTLCEGEDFTVRELMLLPGAELAASSALPGHWSILAGTGQLEQAGADQPLVASQCLSLPAGHYRLRNSGSQPLRVVEVSLGVAPAAVA